MSDDVEEPELEPIVEVTDEQLADLLNDHHEHEEIMRQALNIGVFYTKLKDRIDFIAATDGNIHDPALEITREWMSYTMGEW